MSRRGPSGSPKVPKKEQCPCTASGQPCAQDTNPAAMPAETTDTRCLTLVYTRSPACEHQETEAEQRLPQNIVENDQHSEFVADRTDCQSNKRLSDNGLPVIESQTNDTGQYIRQDSSASTSTRCSSFGGLSSSLGSNQLQLSQSRYCQTCRLLMKRFPCEASKNFWEDIDKEGPDSSQSCHKKFFDKFLERLQDQFQYDEGLHSKCTINLLKMLLKVDPKDITAGVKLADLIRVVTLIGPIKLEDNKCILIRQLHDIIKKSLKVRDKSKTSKSSWFVGDMTRSEAEEALLARDCKDKTYLIRISGTDGGDGDFVLSVRHEDHCHHLKIKGNPEQALKDSPYNANLKFAGQEFSSLPDIVDYISANNDIEIEQDSDDEDQNCQYVTCLRVFLKSPLNGPMSGYEKTKR